MLMRLGQATILGFFILIECWFLFFLIFDAMTPTELVEDPAINPIRTSIVALILIIATTLHLRRSDA